VLAGEPPLTLDLAATRREHYPRPAALPQVEPASIADDLHRRDFSINALALRLTMQDNLLHGTQLLDPFDGQRDLAAGLLRVLHAQSFADDPTRMLRGLRLAVRLGMQFAPETANLLAAALAAGMLEATTPDRIRGELCLALEEPDPGAVLRQARALGMLPHIYPPLERLAAQMQATPCDQHADPLVQAGLLTYDLCRAEREELIARYRLPGAAARLLRDVATLRERRADLCRPALRNSELDSLLRDAVVSAVHVIRCAEADTLGTRIQHYLTHVRGVAPLLDGHALRELGIAPGPRMGALLAGLRAARLDGLLHSRADEEHWVRQQIADPSA
jgi:tRNA nucleotidyltransferase (CCA-adding enzyme)